MPRTRGVTSKNTVARMHALTVYRRMLPTVILEQNAVEKHIRQRTGYRAEASVRKVAPSRINQHTTS